MDLCFLVGWFGSSCVFSVVRFLWVLFFFFPALCPFCILPVYLGVPTLFV